MTTQTRPPIADAAPYHGGSGAQTAFDLTLLLALADIPSVTALAVTDRPSGTLTYLALGDMTQEDRVYEQLTVAQGQLGNIAIKLICVPVEDWDRLEFSPSARRYTF